MTVPRRTEPAIALPAVSVIPLRDGPAGLETFVQYRAATMDFAAGAVVFPGGRLDAGDVDSDVVLTDDQAALQRDAWHRVPLVSDSSHPSSTVRALLAAAIREVREEAGVHLEPADLVPWDNWITPERSPKRFDVAFFVVADQGGPWANRTTEAVSAEWLPVTDILRRGTAGELRLMRPTRAILTELAALGTVAAVLDLEPLIEPVFDDRPQPRPRQSRTTQRPPG